MLAVMPRRIIDGSCHQQKRHDEHAHIIPCASIPPPAKTKSLAGQANQPMGSQIIQLLRGAVFFWRSQPVPSRSSLIRESVLQRYWRIDMLDDRESFSAIGVLTSAADTINRAKEAEIIS